MPPLAPTAAKDMTPGAPAAVSTQSPPVLAPVAAAPDLITVRSSTTRPAISLDDNELINWINSRVPRFSWVTDLSHSFATGRVLYHLVMRVMLYLPDMPESWFPRGPDDHMLKGLSEIFSFLRRGVHGFDDLNVSIDDIRQGRRGKIIILVQRLQTWEQVHLRAPEPGFFRMFSEHEEDVQWINSHLPGSLHVTNLDESLASGLVLFRLTESIVGVSGGVPDSSFPHSWFDGNIEGLFKLFDLLLENGVGTGDVTMRDIQMNRSHKIEQIIRRLEAWEKSKL